MALQLILESEQQARRAAKIMAAGAAVVCGALTGIAIRFPEATRSRASVLMLVVGLAAIVLLVQSVQELLRPSVMDAIGPEAAAEVANILNGDTPSVAAGSILLTDQWVVSTSGGRVEAERPQQLRWVYAADRSGLNHVDTNTPIRIGLHGPRSSFVADVDSAAASQLFAALLPLCPVARVGYDETLESRTSYARNRALDEIDLSALPRAATFKVGRASQAMGAAAKLIERFPGFASGRSKLPDTMAVIDGDIVKVTGRTVLPMVCPRCGDDAQTVQKIEVIHRSPRQRTMAALGLARLFSGSTPSVRQVVRTPVCDSCQRNSHIPGFAPIMQGMAALGVLVWGLQRGFGSLPVFALHPIPIVAAMLVVASIPLRMHFAVLQTSYVGDDYVGLIDTHPAFREAIVLSRTAPPKQPASFAEVPRDDTSITGPVTPEVLSALASLSNWRPTPPSDTKVSVGAGVSGVSGVPVGGFVEEASIWRDGATG
jgi:hypothetical protein